MRTAISLLCLVFGVLAGYGLGWTLAEAIRLGAPILLVGSASCACVLVSAYLCYSAVNPTKGK